MKTHDVLLSRTLDLRFMNATVKFDGNCPNVKSVIVTDGLSRDGAPALSSYGKELGRLKCVVGVNECHVREGELRGILVGDTGSLTTVRTSRRYASSVGLRCPTRML